MIVFYRHQLVFYVIIASEVDREKGEKEVNKLQFKDLDIIFSYSA